MSWLKDRWKIEEPLPKFCFCGIKERVFCIELLLTMRNGYILRISNAKNRGFHLAKHQHRRHGQIASERRQCSAFGGTRKESCTMNCWKRAKLSMGIATDNNWSIWTMHCSKNGQNGTRDTNEWYCNTSTLRAIALLSSRKTLKLDLLPHPPYSSDLAPSDYHFSRSMAHGLAGLHLANFEEVQNELDEWFQFKDASFYRRGIHVLPERKCGKNV